VRSADEAVGPVAGLYVYVTCKYPLMPMRRPTSKETVLGLALLAVIIPGVYFVITTLNLADSFSLKFTLSISAAIASALTVWAQMYFHTQSRSIQEKKIEQIEIRAEKEPEKTRFAWDLARVKLEAYFDRNLSQVRMIFVVAVGVMLVGFGFILWGVSHAVSNPESVKTSYLAAISGIITEFIGVTFMVIYRSTMAQANQFMEVLERINTVGMAVQILDAIPEQETQLKNSTRAEIVSLLLSVNARSKSSTKKTDAKPLAVK